MIMTVLKVKAFLPFDLEGGGGGGGGDVVSMFSQCPSCTGIYATRFTSKVEGGPDLRRQIDKPTPPAFNRPRLKLGVSICRVGIA